MNKGPNDWYVAQLKPNGLAIAQRNLSRQGFCTLCPLRLETTRVRNMLKSAVRPLFPGYLFVQFQAGKQGWHAIHSTRGVARLILSDIRNPRPLPSEFMAGLIARCDAKGRLSPPEDIKAGDRVRVLSGPFADLVTAVDQLGNDQRIQILIELMGRAVRTSFPRSQIEKLSPVNRPMFVGN
jgi:transcriptional antiterminator RfaH